MDSTSQTVEGKIFLIVENPPIPVGGYESFYKYVGTNINYPKEARTSRITGKVEFVVEKAGAIFPESVKILKGVHKSLDGEAIRLIRRSPKWIPGNQNGIPVRTKVIFPVSFRLG